VQSLGYGLGLRGIVVRFPETPRDVFSPPKNQDRLWGLPSFLFNRYRGVLYSEVKWPRRKTNYSPSFSGEVKSEWNYTSTAPYTFMECMGTT
jgi:hypothetical protein